MSTGGIFKLITNDGIQDKLLMATGYLSHRLKLIEKVNRERPLKQVHKPHILIWIIRGFTLLI